MKNNQIKFVIWYMIEIFSVSVFSFLGSIILSSITILSILSVYLPGEGGPGDGLGILIILIFVVLPTWIIMLGISSIYAKFKFTGKHAFEKRVMFYLIVPIIVTTIISGIVATIMFDRAYTSNSIWPISK